MDLTVWGGLWIMSALSTPLPEKLMPNTLSHRRAVYTGVFDPVHLGHLDIIQRGSKIVDELIVGVGINPDKTPFFSSDERVELLRLVTRDYTNVQIRPFHGLAVRFVREVGARLMLRGLRTLSDMEYEFTMSLMNLNLDSEIETIFLMAKEEFSHVSSSLLRQIAVLEGDLSKFLPHEVGSRLMERAQERRLK
jgi:pantetheine-phosphate adenylyltransferase